MKKIIDILEDETEEQSITESQELHPHLSKHVLYSHIDKFLFDLKESYFNVQVPYIL